MKHKAKKGTVIEANGVKVIVLRGSSELEITAPPEVAISTGQVEVEREKAKRRRMPHSTAAEIICQQTIASSVVRKYDAGHPQGRNA